MHQECVLCTVGRDNCKNIYNPYMEINIHTIPNSLHKFEKYFSNFFKSFTRFYRLFCFSSLK